MRKDLLLCLFVLLTVWCSHSTAFHKEGLLVQSPSYGHTAHNVHIVIPRGGSRDRRKELTASGSNTVPVVSASQSKNGRGVLKPLAIQPTAPTQEGFKVEAPQKVEKEDTTASTIITLTEVTTKEEASGGSKPTTTVEAPKTAGSTKAENKPTTVGKPETSSTTTEVPLTTEAVTTTISTTPKPPLEKDSHPQNLYCLCDLHMNVCDMNCCCDADCNEEDRLLFTKCEDGTGLHDERRFERRQRSCIQNFVFVKHYDVKNLQRTDKGMLCIIRDNNMGDNELPATQLNEIRERIVKGSLKIERKYEWSKKSVEKYKKEPYKYGSPIVGLKSSLDTKDRRNPIPFGLPFPFHGESCPVRQPVLFLQDFQSKCKYPLGNLSSVCEVVNPLDGNYFLQFLDIIANPGDEQNEIVPITRIKSCSGGLCSTEPSQELIAGDFPSPKINPERRVCQDVLVRLNLTILHAGINGLVEILASAEFQDVPLDQSSLLQEYQVHFKWSPEFENNSTNASGTPGVDDWPRSGNPGYIVGKPVIMGRKVSVPQPTSNETKSDEPEKVKMEDRIQVWKDPSRWLTIHNPGICSGQPLLVKRIPTLFDYGHSTSCSLNISKFKYCEDLQEEVAKILFGTEDYLSFDKGPWYVAAYGNSNPAVPSEWVPVTFKSFSSIYSYDKGTPKTLLSKGCDGILSILHIRIAYAFVGSLDFPQARITGVLYELGDSFPLEAVQTEVCAQDSCQMDSTRHPQLSVTTTVTFKDVTAPPVIRVARWPVLTVRLPTDFFYPFSSPSSGSRVALFPQMLIGALVFMLV